MIKIPDKCKIEKLISCYGVTLQDMPHKYRPRDRKIALDMLTMWGGTNTYTRNYADYFCHLMEIIDRLTTALEMSINAKGGRHEGRDLSGHYDIKEPEA